MKQLLRPLCLPPRDVLVRPAACLGASPAMAVVSPAGGVGGGGTRSVVPGVTTSDRGHRGRLSFLGSQTTMGLTILKRTKILSCSVTSPRAGSGQACSQLGPSLIAGPLSLALCSCTSFLQVAQQGTMDSRVLRHVAKTTQSQVLLDLPRLDMTFLF